MKHISLTLTLVAALATSGLYAQSTPAPATQEQRVSEHSLKLAKELGLDQDQTERMAKADRAYADNMAALRAITNDREVLRLKGESLRVEHDRMLQDILSPEQFARLNELRQAKAQEGQQKMSTAKPMPAE